MRGIWRTVPLPWLLAAIVVLFAGSLKASEDEGVEIRAVEEQPRALHLVSWRLPPEPAAPEPRLEGTRLEVLLEPLDDENFLEHLRFRQTLKLNLDGDDDQ